MEELVSRVLVLGSQVREAIHVGLEHPGARRRARCLGGLGARIVPRIVANGEQAAFERGVALRRGLSGLRVDLAEQHAHGIGLGDVGHGLSVDAGGLVRHDGRLVDGRVQGMARGLLGLLHPVVARIEVLELAVAVTVGDDGPRHVREARVAVHGVFRACQGVERVALAHSRVGADLLQVDVPVGDELEREDELISGTRVEHERLEVVRHLTLAGADQASRGIRVALVAIRTEADHVLTAPRLERLVAAEEGVTTVRRERVGEQDVSERGIARVGHGTSVIPGARPEAPVEPRAPVAKPEVRYGLGVAPRGCAYCVLGVAASRRRVR